MTPPLQLFSPLNLPSEAKLSAQSTHRKGFDGNLKNCELLELLQYNCDIQKDKSVKVEDRKIICQPVERLFRRCKDGKGTFMVETTLWEEERSAK